MNKQTTSKKYQVVVDSIDSKCLTLLGKEFWPETELDDAFVTDDKSIAEIIVNAANYARDNGTVTPHYYYTHMDRVLWVEPRHPKPDLRR